MDVNRIRQLLPHRYPFLLVDRVIELEKDDYIKAYKNVSVNEPFFTGHFPEYPFMPGVLIIDAMAHAAGVLGFETMGKTPEDGSIYLFVGCEKTRFKRQVVPGDRLDMTATKITSRRGIWKFDCHAEVDGDTVATSTILVAERQVD